MYEYDPYIEKITVVANEKWQDQILMFVGAGMRAAQVMFFHTGEGKKPGIGSKAKMSSLLL